MKQDNEATKDLSILGKTVTRPITADELETFPAPEGVSRVSFGTDELTSNCPLTHQPDYYDLEIDYVPDQLCIESKALKLYLWQYRDSGQFCEQLAVKIQSDLVRALSPVSLTVTLKMAARGGITMKAVSSYVR